MPILPDTTKAIPYDPREFGSVCVFCALQKEPMCTPELRPETSILVVAEAPGRHEVILDRPLVGQSGKELDRVLHKTGLKRSDCSFTNVMLCRPPGNDLTVCMAKTRKKNKLLKAKKKPLIWQPTEACLARLLFELYHFDFALLLGKVAWEAVYSIRGGKSKFDKARGYPDELMLPPLEGFEPKKIKLLTTVHPSFVLRKRRWTIPFENDVAKFHRMYRGTLHYDEPNLLFFPTPEQLDNFLILNKDFLAYDWETNGTEALTAEPWCVGIGNSKAVTCVPFKSIERPAVNYYDKHETEKLFHIFNELFRDKSKIIFSHHGKYDHQIWESNYPWFSFNAKQFDTIIAHHILYSEWKHDLGFLTSQFSDATAHKNVNHDQWSSDYELHKYCMLDVAQTSLAAQKMLADPRLQEMAKAFKTDMFLSEFCRQLHKIGVKIDTDERDKHYKVLNEKMDLKREEIRFYAYEAVRDYKTKGGVELAKNLNPGSGAQVSKFLFNVCGLPPVPEREGGLTASGEYAVGKDQLYYLIDQGLDEKLEKLLYTLIDYKEAQTLRGFCRQEPGFDGRVHANWNPHVVVSGRLSCSNPNLMNLRKFLRSMYVAEPGHLIVTCDKSQLEARVMAILAQDTKRVEAFLDGADIHKLTAMSILGIKRIEDVQKAHRQFAKTFRYAVQYMAGKRTVHRMIKNFLDPKTNKRPYQDIQYAKISRSYDSFWREHSTVLQWHADNRELQAKIGYLYEPLDNRRRYFLDGGGDENKEELANFIIQSCAAADVNAATKRVVERFPWGFAGSNTGVIIQLHDALYLEVPEENALKIGREVQNIMYSELYGMPLPVDLGIGKNFCDLKEVD